MCRFPNYLFMYLLLLLNCRLLKDRDFAFFNLHSLLPRTKSGTYWGPARCFICGTEGTEFVGWKGGHTRGCLIGGQVGKEAGQTFGLGPCIALYHPLDTCPYDLAQWTHG